MCYDVKYMKDFFVSHQDKEVSYGAHAPRILALDDYFLMEVEKSEQDPDTGKKIKKKVSKHVHVSTIEQNSQICESIKEIYLLQTQSTVTQSLFNHY